jgi:hypothetical protein
VLTLKNLVESKACGSIFLLCILTGCTTGPILAGARVEFPNRKFSVLTPPVDWELTKPENQGEVVAWRNRATKSRIAISADEEAPKAVAKVAEKLAEKFPIYPVVSQFFRGERYKGNVIPPTEQKEVDLGGRTFYRVITDLEISPVEGLQVKMKVVRYWLLTEKFYYNLSLATLAGYYEKEQHILEQMARSFTPLE